MEIALQEPGDVSFGRRRCAQSCVTSWRQWLATQCLTGQILSGKCARPNSKRIWTKKTKQKQNYPGLQSSKWIFQKIFFFAKTWRSNCLDVNTHGVSICSPSFFSTEILSKKIPSMEEFVKFSLKGRVHAVWSFCLWCLYVFLDTRLKTQIVFWNVRIEADQRICAVWASGIAWEDSGMKVQTGQQSFINVWTKQRLV